MTMEKTNTGEAESAVMELIGRMAGAWQRGDGEAYGALFADDAQYVTAPGERLHGRRAIEESHQRVFDSFFKNTRVGRDYPIQLRVLTPDVVLVEACGSVLFPGETENAVPPNGLMTLVLTKVDETWRIVSFQNTPTGRLRNLRFIFRYLLSRLWLFRREWAKGKQHMMEEKRRNLAKWN
jgi:uncharacterized protein (TIGR02246 family)